MTVYVALWHDPYGSPMCELCLGVYSSEEEAWKAIDASWHSRESCTVQSEIVDAPIL